MRKPRDVSWDELFMSMVYLIAMKSKDNHTHIGAVVVDKNHKIRSLGYNGFPRGINDNKSWRQEKPEKYFWFEHAETNALHNRDLSLEGCVMYTNGIPCADCARAIIQSGLKEVVYDFYWNEENSDKWKNSCNRSKKMFREARVKLRGYKGRKLNITGWRNGDWWKL